MPEMKLSEFVTFLERMAAGMDAAEKRGLEQAGKIISTEAKTEIGEYQGAYGGFPRWEKLAESTLEGWGGFPGKIDLGFAPPDNPLLRTGALRRSIGYTVSNRRLLVGSTSQIAFWQEFGTTPAPGHPGIPPRSFIGRATARKAREATEAIADRVFGPLKRGRLR